MKRRVLVLLLTSLFALLPQGRARVTICIADPDDRVGATQTVVLEHSCCAAGACEQLPGPEPDEATIDDHAPCDCCLEFEAGTARDPASTPHELDPGGADAMPPRAPITMSAPRHDRPFVPRPERARAGRPPPRFALRI
ncbi:MAG: hypothetical protein IPH13_09925 [Planctomycetes bacterium]|nr:hypothetical protein [Planctomycetota bacterium]MCC7171361.1 hypothetical protein [Planctomycetota bacterium]